MKNLFKKEQAIFSHIKSIRLPDLNLGGAFLALIIVVISMFTHNISLVPDIASLMNVFLFLIVVLLLSIVVKPHVEKRELHAFLCVEIMLLLILILLLSFVPQSIDFVKVFISLYAVFNLFVFILYGACDYVKKEKVIAEPEVEIEDVEEVFDDVLEIEEEKKDEEIEEMEEDKKDKPVE